jgi:hypothetical protein
MKPAAVLALSSVFVGGAMLLTNCTVLNSYEPIGVGLGGSGATGGSEATGGGGQGGLGPQGGGGSAPTCNDAACAQASTECISCSCLEGLVCDCDPLPQGTPCSGGVCVEGGCVECLDNSGCLNGGTCVQNLCVGAACTDSVLNGGETDVDCGGPDCAPCSLGSNCNVGEDCQTLRCDNGVCLTCNTQSDCSSTFLYCAVVSSSCEEKKETFGPCVNDYECLSGVCNQLLLCAL